MLFPYLQHVLMLKYFFFIQSFVMRRHNLGYMFHAGFNRIHALVIMNSYNTLRIFFDMTYHLSTPHDKVSTIIPYSM